MIEAALMPGEALVAVMNWDHESPGGTLGGIMTAGLTDRNLYSVGFKTSVRRGIESLDACQALPLSALSSTAHVKEKKVLRKEVFEAEFRWSDGRFDRVSTTDVEAGEEFIDLLREVHHRVQSATVSGSSTAEELAKLAELKAQGLLTEDDWERAKDFFLGKTPDERKQTVENLRQLHGLLTSGVLSESEFNDKKWGVLSRS